PSTSSTWTTTAPTPARSARCGGGSAARTIPPPPGSASPGCGTPTPSSRCRGTPSSEDAGTTSARDQRVGVLRRGIAQAVVQGREQLARLLARPAVGQEVEGDAGVEVRQPTPGRQHRDVRRE